MYICVCHSVFGMALSGDVLIRAAINSLWGTYDNRPANSSDLSVQSSSSCHQPPCIGPVGSRQHIPLQKIFTYKVLSELLTEIQGAKNSAKIMNISNRFYTIIPYNFNTKKPPLLDKKEVVKLKVQMVDKWLEIEVSYSLLKDKAEEGSSKDPNETSTPIEHKADMEA